MLNKNINKDIENALKTDEKIQQFRKALKKHGKVFEVSLYEDKIIVEFADSFGITWEW